MADPAVIAKAGYEAMLRGDDKALASLGNKVQMALANVLPATLLADQMKQMSEPVEPANN